TLYRLRQYPDAEAAYRSAAEGDQLRTARAAYDRGNTLLQQALQDGARPDPAFLTEAAEGYRRCLDQESVVPQAGDLFTDVRHNLELARLIQRQAAGASGQSLANTPLLAARGPNQEKEDLCPD